MLAPRINTTGCPPYITAKKESRISTAHIKCLAKYNRSPSLAGRVPKAAVMSG